MLYSICLFFVIVIFEIDFDNFKDKYKILQKKKVYLKPNAFV